MVDVLVMGVRIDLLDFSVETVLGVGGVLDHPCGTVRFDETVRALDVTVTVAGLVLALYVVGMRIFHAVLEMVRGGGAVRVVLVVVIGVTVVILGRVGEC